MKLLIALFPLLLFCSVINAQSNTKKTLKDSLRLIGTIKSQCYGDSVQPEYCLVNPILSFQEGDKVYIADVYYCPKLTKGDTVKFYEVLHKEKMYFIDESNISFDSNTAFMLSVMTREHFDKLKRYSLSLLKLEQVKKQKKILSFVEYTKSQGLVLMDYSLIDESEYTKGSSVKISVFNPTKKVIKYIWFSFVGYNAVNDIIIDPFKRTSVIKVQAIGPIESSSIADYNFEYVWHTDLVQTMKISTIKVQYMDGTFKTIGKPNSILMNEEYLNQLE